MSSCTPAASNAALRYLRSAVSQRAEVLLSGRMTPTLPGAVAPPVLPLPVVAVVAATGGDAADGQQADRGEGEHSLTHS